MTFRPAQAAWYAHKSRAYPSAWSSAARDGCSVPLSSSTATHPRSGTTTSGRRESRGSSYSRMAVYSRADESRTASSRHSRCSHGMHWSQARTCSSDASRMNACNRASRLLKN